MGVLNMVTLAAIFVEFVFGVRALAAIPGSHQRFVALSFRRIASWSVIALFAVQGLLGFTTGDAADGVWGVIYVGVAAWLAMSELRNHHDDHDWFNGRGKKIVAGIRTAFTPRAARSPSFA
jgi:uncharacterized membrane protein